MIKEWLVGLIAPKYVKNIARHLTGAMATWLVTVAEINPDLIDGWIEPTSAILSGLIMFILTLLLSIKNTKSLEK